MADTEQAPAPLLTLEQFNALRSDVVKLENKILDVMAEFGGQPEQCLSIIGELIDQRQHFRAHPNAPRVD